jgi:hypothetical protein
LPVIFQHPLVGISSMSSMAQSPLPRLAGFQIGVEFPTLAPPQNLLRVPRTDTMPVQIRSSESDVHNAFVPSQNRLVCFSAKGAGGTNAGTGGLVTGQDPGT